MLQPALALIDADDERLIADLRRIVAIDTTLPPGRGYSEIADVLAEAVEALGFSCTRVTVPETLWRSPVLAFAGERVNLVARRPTGKPALSIYAHTDVVPAGPGWSVDPFAGVVNDGRLYGRGAADMKGTIAALLAALRAAHATGLELRFDPVLLFCTDEEGGTYPGVRYLAEHGFIEGHLLCMDGQAALRLWAGCFGSIDFRILVKGRAGHTGAPAGSVNAIEGALPVMNALMALKARVEARVSALPPPPRQAGAPLRPLLALTMLSAGIKTTVVPDRLELFLNRRYAPEENADEVIAELEAAVKGAVDPAGAADIEIALAAHLAPVRNPIGPHWPRWQQALSLGFGFAPGSFALYGAASSSDMGWVQACGIEEILLGGVGRPESNVHARDEWVAIADLKGLARAILAYSSAEFGGPT
ncbi:MAG: M20 family metallopeptidase [Pseudomonadota bacterium]